MAPKNKKVVVAVPGTGRYATRGSGVATQPQVVLAPSKKKSASVVSSVSSDSEDEGGIDVSGTYEPKKTDDEESEHESDEEDVEEGVDDIENPDTDESLEKNKRPNAKYGKDGKNDDMDVDFEDLNLATGGGGNATEQDELDEEEPLKELKPPALLNNDPTDHSSVIQTLEDVPDIQSWPFKPSKPLFFKAYHDLVFSKVQYDDPNLKAYLQGCVARYHSAVGELGKKQFVRALQVLMKDPQTFFVKIERTYAEVRVRES